LHHEGQANALNHKLSLSMSKVRYNPFTQGIILSVSVLLLGGIIYTSQLLASEAGRHGEVSLSPARQEFKQLAWLSDLKKEFILKPYSGEIQFSVYHQSNPEERWNNWTLWERTVQVCLSPKSRESGLNSEYANKPKTNLPEFWLTRGWTLVSQLFIRSFSFLLSDKPG